MDTNRSDKAFNMPYDTDKEIEKFGKVIRYGIEKKSFNIIMDLVKAHADYEILRIKDDDLYTWFYYSKMWRCFISQYYVMFYCYMRDFIDFILNPLDYFN